MTTLAKTRRRPVPTGIANCDPNHVRVAQGQHRHPARGDLRELARLTAHMDHESVVVNRTVEELADVDVVRSSRILHVHSGGGGRQDRPPSIVLDSHISAFSFRLH